MMFALGAASSLLDSLQALTAPNSSSASSQATQGQGAASPFDLVASAPTTATPTTGFSAGTSGFSAISPQTMSALLDAQSQAGTTSSAPTNPSDALQDLFSQIDGNGDGSISKSEFENALGAGGTNTANADKVFGELDSNGDGSVSTDELKSALQGAGHHGGHHHMHASASSNSTDPASTDGSTDPSANPLTQALAAGSPSNGAGSASSSYDMIKQAMARAEQMFASSTAASLSVSA